MPKRTKKTDINPAFFGPHQTVESFTQQIKEMMNAGDIHALEITCRHTIKNFKRIGRKTSANFLKQIFEDWLDYLTFRVALGHHPKSPLWELGEIDRTMVFEDLLDAQTNIEVLRALFRKFDGETKEEMRLRVDELTEDCAPDKLPYMLVVHRAFGCDPFDADAYISARMDEYSMHEITAGLKTGMAAAAAVS